tara:strand:- start:2376 stop:2768 length:393 start_codon:yes stop_codon:yes gene_type:complete
MVGGREGDNTSLGLVMFRETGERFVLINHDKVSHLERGKRVWREAGVEIGPREGYDYRSLAVVMTLCHGMVALLCIEGDQEINICALPFRGNPDFVAKGREFSGPAHRTTGIPVVQGAGRHDKNVQDPQP